MKIQEKKPLYFETNYASPERFASYGYQFKEILALKPKNVLEIGIGNGIIAYMLKKGGIDITTIDIDESLEPDIIAAVTNMPFSDESFDIVACFEVLEHIPFEYFIKALKEIRRIVLRYAIISLPDCKHCLRLYLPKIGRRFFLLDHPFFRPPDHKFDSEHYWEINKKGYPLKKIIDMIEKAGFSIEKTFRAWEMPQHRFFQLHKSEASIKALSL